MDIDLLMRERDVVLGKRRLHRLVQSEVYGPVIAGLEPGTEFERGQTALGHGDQGFGRGILQYELVGVCTLEQQRMDLLTVRGGAQRDVDVETAEFVCVEVLDRAVGERSVRQRDAEVVQATPGT